MKKVLTTGIYGLIGNVVHRRLLEEPDRFESYGLTRRRASSDRIAESNLTPVPDDRLFVHDLTDFEGVKQAAEGMDAVVHMAA